MDQAAKLAEKPFLVIERRFPVAAEKVWRAWTDPQVLTFDEAARDGHQRGWSEKLDQFLQGGLQS